MARPQTDIDAGREQLIDLVIGLIEERGSNSLTVAGQVIWGVSTLRAHGLLVRGVSQSNRLLTPMLLRFWQLAKQELYQAAAVLPRKIY